MYGEFLCTSWDSNYYSIQLVDIIHSEKHE